jgi:alpha-tubulin suppressor-like RCC1 family protein
MKPTQLLSNDMNSTSGEQGLALKSDGSVIAWGSNAFGESTVPMGLSGVIAISAGGGNSLALRACLKSQLFSQTA